MLNLSTHLWIGIAWYPNKQPLSFLLSTFLILGNFKCNVVAIFIRCLCYRPICRVAIMDDCCTKAWLPCSSKNEKNASH